MMVLLKELIETGRFGSVRLGVSRAQVERCLGVPDDLGGISRRYPQPSIWKYGDVELHFVMGTDALRMIHLDDLEVPAGGKAIDLDPWIIRRGLTLAEAEEHLSRHGVDYEVGDCAYAEDAKCVTAGVGVKLIFIGHGRSLEVMNYAAPRNLTTP